MPKSIAVVYHYFEKNLKYRDNLIFFLSVGILDQHDYYIVIAGECTVNFPQKDNVFFIKTENKNNDYGGYSEFIKTQNIKNYDFFIFINSSVRGPFLPNYSSLDWTSPFINKLCNKTHLVGATINLLPTSSIHSQTFENKFSYPPPYTHVQTTSYALTAEALQHLIYIGFYDNDRLMSKDEVIAFYELRLSREIIKKGWNFSSLLPFYDDIDYRHHNGVIDNFSTKDGDLLFKKSFFARTLNPYEIIFIKVNRNLLPPEELDSYTYTALCKQSSNNLFLESEELVNKNRENIKKFSLLRKKYQRIYKFFGVRNLLSRMSRFI